MFDMSENDKNEILWQFQLPEPDITRDYIWSHKLVCETISTLHAVRDYHFFVSHATQHYYSYNSNC